MSLCKYTFLLIILTKTQNLIGGQVVHFCLTTYNILTHTLPIATADTLEITNTAITILKELYRPDIQYKKSRVILGDISFNKVVTQYLFDPIPNRPERHHLMQLIDKINQRYGTKNILLGVEGVENQKWTTKCEQRTPNYLTDINEIMTIKI